MFVLIVGIGRVGSALARSMLEQGHEVSCIDEDPDALTKLEVGLGRGWVEAGGSFTVGQGLEVDALLTAGVERADAFVAATDGDNTNIVISQIARERFQVPTVVARVLDPWRAAWYEEQGVRTISPTRAAIEMLQEEVVDGAVRERGVGE